MFASGGTWWRSWLSHSATSWKVAVSIPNFVSGIFHCHNSSGQTVTLGLIEPPTTLITRNIF